MRICNTTDKSPVVYIGNFLPEMNLSGWLRIQTPPYSEGSRTKMLTHFLYHVTLIR